MVAASESLAEPVRPEEQRDARRGALSTGDMARLSNSTLRTVRFYEQAGLLKSLSRTDGGRRLFPESELDKLRLVGELRTAGLSLEEIQDVLATKHESTSGSQAAGQLSAKLDAHIATLKERMQSMNRLLSELNEAQARLRGCADCHAAELFPDNCGACGVMSSVKESAAVSVLWGIRR